MQAPCGWFLKTGGKMRGCKVKKSRKTRCHAVSPFRDKLWDLFKEQAKGMDGSDAVTALKQAGEEIWAVGIDDTCNSMSHPRRASSAMLSTSPGSPSFALSSKR